LVFKDRREAGQKLAQELEGKNYDSPVVIGIPRGGVPLAEEVAETLHAPLDIIVPRKIGAPGNPEYAVGAVTEDGTVVRNEEAVQRTGADQDYLERAAEQELKEVKRRLRKYRGDRQPVDIEGKTTILVDDGVATGTTLKAAIKSAKKRNPANIVVAVPVGAESSIQDIKQEVDEVICLETPGLFGAVGQYYRSFPQTPDEEVVEAMKNAER